MFKDIKCRTEVLSLLLKVVNNEEIQPDLSSLATDQACKIENDILTEIDQRLETETNIKNIQKLYDFREKTWDLVAQIINREIQLCGKAHDITRYQSKEKGKGKKSHDVKHKKCSCHSDQACQKKHTKKSCDSSSEKCEC